VTRILIKRLKEVGVEYLLVGMKNNFEYVLSINSIERSKVESLTLGNIDIWGNAHDVDFSDYWTPPRHSNLPGFPFQYEELSKETEILNRLLNIKSNLMKSGKASQEEYFFRKHIHIRGGRKIFKNIAPLTEDAMTRSIDDSLDISKTSTNEILISFIDTNGQLLEIKADYLLIASGGLGNLVRVHQILNKLGNSKSSNLGVGYSNHPKFISHEIEFKKFKKIKNTKRIFRIKNIWESFNVFDSEDYLHPEGRSPRVSHRFWPAIRPLRTRILANPSYVASILMERILLKIGYCRRFQVMTYLEMPQIRESTLSYNPNQDTLKFLDHQAPANLALEAHFASRLHVVTEYFKKSSETLTVVQKTKDLSEVLLHDSHHYMGTTRMSLHANDGVVNEWGELHEFRGVYCIGTSTLPVSATNHPTYLAILLGLRSVEKIIDEIQKEKSGE
jgi:hypothetical protein